MPFRPNVHDELTLNGVTRRVKNHQDTKTQSFLRGEKNEPPRHQDTKISLPFEPSW